MGRQCLLPNNLNTVHHTERSLRHSPDTSDLSWFLATFLASRKKQRYASYRCLQIALLFRRALPLTCASHCRRITIGIDHKSLRRWVRAVTLLCCTNNVSFTRTLIQYHSGQALSSGNFSNFTDNLLGLSGLSDLSELVFLPCFQNALAAFHPSRKYKPAGSFPAIKAYSAAEFVSPIWSFPPFKLTPQPDL